MFCRRRSRAASALSTQSQMAMGICGRVLGRFTGGGSDVGQPRSESSCIHRGLQYGTHIWLGWRL